jgi:UDP-GlcNAc3NAcA epimerase
MPEEINRILTDRISSFLFVPTTTAQNHLNNEGITKGVHLVGDIMLDASLYYRNKNKSTIVKDLQEKYAINGFSLATIHRAENTDNKIRLNEIIQGLGLINENIILPLHPRTKKQIELFNIEIPDTIIIIEPIGYFDMLALEDQCNYIFTDSGGVQKEAYFFKKPCFTFRNETEWVETVEAGWNKLVEANKEEILNDFQNFEKPHDYPELYGNGDTAEQILNALITNVNMKY